MTSRFFASHRHHRTVVHGLSEGLIVTDQRRHRSVFRQRKSWAISAAVAGICGFGLIPAQATQYIYTPAAGATDNWSAGTDWSAIPVSATDARLTFVGTNTTTFASGLLNASTNDIVGTGTGGAFILNRLDLQGTGPTSGGDVAVTLNGNDLEFVNNGSVPILNLVANKNGQGGSPAVSYTVNNNLILDNTTSFSGGGSAKFTFAGAISGVGNLHRLSGSVMTFNGSLSNSGGMTLDSGTTILNAANAYTGGTSINSGATLSIGASGTLGGNVVGNNVNVGGGAVLLLSAAGDAGSNQSLNLRYSLTTEPVLGVSDNFVPVVMSVPVANTAGISPVTGGVLAINTADYNALTSLASLGNGGMFLGTTIGGTYANATLGAGSGNVYRLGGGGSTSNALVLAGTGADNLLSGNNSVQVGDSRSVGLVLISNGGNDYTGGTAVTGGSTLQTDVTTSSTPLGSIATAASRGITLDNGTLKIGSSSLTATQTVAVAGYDLNVPSTGNLALTHGAGVATFTANSINRVGHGVLEINPTSGYVSSSSPGSLGISEQVLVSVAAPAVVNGMVAPYIVDGGVGVPQSGLSNNFLTYDPVKGFIDATYTQTDIPSGVFPTGVTGTDVVGLNATANGKTYATGGDVSLYALRMTTGTFGQTVTLGSASTPDTMTISSGGLILAVGGGSTTYKINENLAFGSAEAIIGPGGSTNTFNGTITGTGGLTFYGSGAFNVANVTGVTGGINVEGGTMRAGSAWGAGNAVSVNGTGSLMLNLSGGANISQTVTSLSGNGKVTSDGTGAYTLTIDGGAGTDTSTFSGPIGGGANLSLVKLGSTTQILAGGNSYTGTTTISNGTLQLGDGVNNDGAIAGASMIDNAALVFSNPLNQTYSGVISGSGTLTKNGAGTLILTGSNTVTGTTTIAAGILQLGDGATLNGSVASGSIVDQSALVFANHSVQSYSGAISGAGTVAKSGGSTLTLSAVNTYSGGTTLNSGELSVSSDDNIGGPATAITFSGGILGVTGTTLNNLKAHVLNGSTFTGGFDIAANVFTVNQSLTGTGNLTKNGAGTLIVASANLSGIGAINAGTLQLGDGVTSNGSVSGNISDGPTTNTATLIYANPADLAYSGVISGQGAVVKTGPGTLTFNGSTPNTYTGKTFVNGGTLALDFNANSPSSILASSSGLSLGGGTLSIVGMTLGTTAQTLSTFTLNTGQSGISLNPNGGAGTTLTLGALGSTSAGSAVLLTAPTGTTLTTTSALSGGAATYENRIVFTDGAGNYDWATTTSLSSPYVISMAGTTAAMPSSGFNPQNYLLTGSGSITAPLTINSLKIVTTGSGQSLAINAGASLGLPYGTILFTGDNDYTITGGTISPGNSGIGAYDVILQQYAANNNLTIASNIVNGGQATSLTKAGPGAVTLSGSNTYTNGTYVDSGTLTLDAAGSIAGNSVIVANGSTLNLNGALTAAPAVSTSGTVNVGGNIAGGGVVTRTWSALTVNAGGSVALADAASHTDHTLLVIGSLSNSAGGTVDLGGNDLIVHNGNLADITNQLASGFNHGSGYWSGNGIVSSTAAADHSYLTTLGVATGLSSLDGGSVSTTDILVKYTYYGDADLSGKVDGTDYSMIDVGYNSQSGGSRLSGWANGDFNYDGKIDGSDYSLIDNAFNLQGSNGLASPMNMVAMNTSEIAGAVPEPGSLMLLGMGAVSLLSRRRCRR
jgi:autotransporter-associated beta strand protein